MQRVIALIMLLLLSPLLLVVAIAILTIDRESAIFKQWRVGQYNKPFKIYKFRTMTNGEVTKLGRILRKTHLDELPQLLNIVLGQMAFIGPRPEQVDLVYAFESECSDYNRRHAILGGISGLAQVKLGHSAHWQQKMIWDLEYVDTKNFWLDAKIVWWTILDCVFGEGR